MKKTRPHPIVAVPNLGQIGQAIEQAMQQAADQNGLPAAQPGETPWLAGSTQPVQDGVYRRATLAGSTKFSLWANGRWHWNCVTPALAAQQTDLSLAQRMPWCGLLQPPVYGYGTTSTAQAAEATQPAAATAATTTNPQGAAC